jgi:hypothetical protein
MLPSLALEPPAGEHRIHEIKFDGFRTVLVVEDGGARAFTRNRLDWSDRYRPIVEAAGKLHCRSAVIDGEMLAVDDAGRSDFDAMRTAIALRGRGLVFVAFDLMFLDGNDLRALPISTEPAGSSYDISAAAAAKASLTTRREVSSHRRRVRLTDQKIQVSGDLAYELGVERGTITMAGQEVTLDHRVTNVYRREAGTWKIVHHHTDVAPALLDVLKRKSR